MSFAPAAAKTAFWIWPFSYYFAARCSSCVHAAKEGEETAGFLYFGGAITCLIRNDSYLSTNIVVDMGRCERPVCQQRSNAI